MPDFIVLLSQWLTVLFVLSMFASLLLLLSGYLINKFIRTKNLLQAVVFVLKHKRGE